MNLNKEEATLRLTVGRRKSVRVLEQDMLQTWTSTLKLRFLVQVTTVIFQTKRLCVLGILQRAIASEFVGCFAQLFFKGCPLCPLTTDRPKRLIKLKEVLKSFNQMLHQRNWHSDSVLLCSASS